MTNAELIATIRNEIERLKKAQEVSEDKDYTQYELDIACGYDVACNDILSFLSTLESEKPVPNDLEEAAEEYIKKGKYLPEGFVVRPAFIAGAKWQEKKDQETIKLAEDHAFLAGADWQREQMMKEAVEGLICATITGTNAISFLSPLPKELTAGDKVRVIVLKKED